MQNKITFEDTNLKHIYNLKESGKNRDVGRDLSYLSVQITA